MGCYAPYTQIEFRTSTMTVHHKMMLKLAVSSTTPISLSCIITFQGLIDNSSEDPGVSKSAREMKVKELSWRRIG